MSTTNATCTLTVFQPGKQPMVYDLDAFQKDNLTLGRGPYHGDSAASPRNDIVIDPEIRFISRAHCILSRTQNGWALVDDQSRSGIWYQGKKVMRLDLHDGDKVYFQENDSNRLLIAFSCRVQTQSSRIESYSLLDKPRFVIGRQNGCDIVIPHPTVSRQHCIITYEGGGFYIADNNSMNGVLLNGTPLSRKSKLNAMDKITIADTTLIFSDGKLFLNKPTGGVTVTAEHVFRKVGKKGAQKCITNDVSLTIQPNEFVAIVGGSGAGKTTLLNCLSGMTGFTSGEIYINGESISTAGKNLRSLMGYVPQQDIVYDTLTLERMLYYSARLRMPQDTSAQEIEAKINETLETVELSEHRKTMINKLSGGQKKRASIAVELLASPKLFFLDEPSSGLDPGTEKHLMRMLKRLSESGKTVVMVTHTVQNIDLCDRLICMGKGGVLCYSGAPADALKFFGKERMTDIYDDLNENSKAVSERFKNTYTGQYAQPGELTPVKASTSAKGMKTLVRQMNVITQRYAEIMKNSTSRLLLLLLMPIFLTFLVCIAYQADGGIFNALGIDITRNTFPFYVASDTLSLVSAFSCAAFWIGIFNSIQEISKERTIFERERFTGVAISPYVMSKFSILTLLCVVQSVMMTTILWFMSQTVATVNPGKGASNDLYFGLTKLVEPADVIFSGNGLWLELFITTFLCVLSAMCLGLAISSIASNDLALVLCPVALLPQLLFSGVATTLSGATEFISNFVSGRWSCVSMLTSVNVNAMYESCEYSQQKWLTTELESGLVDAAYSAAEEDNMYLFGLNPVVSGWIALFLISVVCVLLAYGILTLKSKRVR